jgi:hypothetical protein
MSCWGLEEFTATRTIFSFIASNGEKRKELGLNKRI